MQSREAYNGIRYREGDAKGHYESWFQRANHPERPLAFWIRYTIFVPRGRPADAKGELWAIAFDGEAKRIVAVKEEHPFDRCRFAKDGLDARIAESVLDGEHLEGEAKSHGHHLGWSLRYTSSEAPLLLLPRKLYEGGFPKAKALVGAPNARFDGELRIDGERWPVEGWVGSQNHNWGSRHTDRYAWGQVAGFDGAPGSFLEVSTAQVKLGPLLTPPLTVLVLRLDGEELQLNALTRAIRARGRYDLFHWTFASKENGTEVSGTITAPPWAFVGLPYANPPGGMKTCLNSKLAACDLTVRRAGKPPRNLHTAHRAAFEILTDEGGHGVPVLGG